MGVILIRAVELSTSANIAVCLQAEERTARFTGCCAERVSPRLSLRRRHNHGQDYYTQKCRVHLVIEEGTATDQILQGQDMSHEEMHGSLREQMTEHM